MSLCQTSVLFSKKTLIKRRIAAKRGVTVTLHAWLRLRVPHEFDDHLNHLPSTTCRPSWSICDEREKPTSSTLEFPCPISSAGPAVVHYPPRGAQPIPSSSEKASAGHLSSTTRTVEFIRLAHLLRMCALEQSNGPRLRILQLGGIEPPYPSPVLKAGNK